MLRRCVGIILLVAAVDAAREKPQPDLELTAASVERVWAPEPDEESMLETTAQAFRMREQFRQAAYGKDLDDWRANVAAFLERKHVVGDGDEAPKGGNTSKWVKRWAGKLEPKANAVGRGAFGKVYVATVGCSKTKVAVKQMKCKQSEVDDEANTMKAFSTPHFVHYFDHGKGEDGSYYIMMEAALGDTLGKIVDGRKPSSREDHARLLVDMLEGIDEMHARQVVHRDLKPANVLVSRTCGGSTPCHAKVADLGLACAAGPKIKGIPKCKGMAGTPIYMAPETYAFGSIDPQNDVWALGLMYYELQWLQLPPEIENSYTMQDLELNIQNFKIAKDVNFKIMPEGPQKELLHGMLQNVPDKRMTAKQALVVAKQLVKEEDEDVVGDLPSCWSTGMPATKVQVIKPVTKAPVAKPVVTKQPAQKPAVAKPDIADDDENFGDEDADFFTIAQATKDIEVSMIFNKDVVHQKSGSVVASQATMSKVQKYLVKSKLKPGDTILEVNDLAFSKLTDKQKDMLKQGLLGRSLTFKVLRG